MTNSTINIGHRGSAGWVLENTLESIEHAISLGVDMIEIDVHLLKSGEIVVFHDDNLLRLAGIDREISDCTWAFIQSIRLQNKYKIPLLSEVISCISWHCKLNIELKGAHTAIPVAHILRTKAYYEMLDLRTFIISSFRHEELKIMRDELPSIPIGILPTSNLITTMAFAKKVGASSIHPDYKSLRKRDVRKMQDAGYRVYPWTVNKEKDKAKMEALGVDGIITDYP